MPGWGTPESFTAFTGLSGFNSLANGSATGVTNTLDNATDKYEFISLKLDLGSLTPTGSPSVQCYIVYAMDGTNFDTVSAASAELLCTFSMSTATTAKIMSRPNRPIAPFKFQLFLVNNTGPALASSGNALSYSRHNEA
jgi:hypothetical protein